MIWESLILAYLLLLVGYALYRYWLRSSLSLLQRKYSLLLIVGIALSLPWTTGQLASYVELKQAASSYKAWNVVDIADKELLDCYERAATNSDICTCELKQQGQKVQFDYLPLYSFFLTSSWYALRIGAFIGLLLFLRLLWGIYGLWRMSRESEAEAKSFEGFVFYRILQAQPWSMSAFSLGRHYLLWGNAWQNCSEEHRRAILAHEICHLRQGDTYWRILWGFLQCFFFCHPLFYNLRSEFVLLCELLADRKAAEKMPSPKAYAQLLIQVQQQRQTTQSPALSLALGQQHLRKRIVYLLQGSQPKVKQQALWRLAAVIGLMLLTTWATLPALRAQQQDLLHYEQQKTRPTIIQAPCPSCED